MSEQQERPEEAGTPENPRGSFWAGFLGAGIPISLFGLLSLIGDVNRSGFATLWFIGALAWIVAFFVMLALYLAQRPATGTGVLAALGVGLLVLFTTCFANLSDVRFG